MNDTLDSGVKINIRKEFYHQDCEALLFPYTEYVAKTFSM